MKTGRHRGTGVIGQEYTLSGLGGVQAPLVEDSYCPVQGCYRVAVSIGTHCAMHRQRMVRTGTTDRMSKGDWVSDSAGPECQICGRSVYEHDVTEFCQQMMGRAVA